MNWSANIHIFFEDGSEGLTEVLFVYRGSADDPISSIEDLARDAFTNQCIYYPIALDIAPPLVRRIVVISHGPNLYP